MARLVIVTNEETGKHRQCNNEIGKEILRFLRAHGAIMSSSTVSLKTLVSSVYVLVLRVEDHGLVMCQ